MKNGKLRRQEDPATCLFANYRNTPHTALTGRFLPYAIAMLAILLVFSSLEAELYAKTEETGLSGSNPADSNKVIGLVKDSQGRSLSGVRVTEFQTDKEYTTDDGGKFVSAFGPSDKWRFFFAVDRQRQLVGVGRLPAEESHVEITLVSARIVSGTVVDPGGRPVAGVYIVPSPVTNFHVLTDKGGKFDVGWNPEWAAGRQDLCLIALCSELNLAALIDIMPNTKTAEIRLEPGLVLTGTVEDVYGDPVGGARVGLSLTDKGGIPVKDVNTNDRGCYEFKGLPQRQEYSISASARGYNAGRVSTGLIQNEIDVAEVQPIVMKPMNMSVSGIVMDVDGKAVVDAEVKMQGTCEHGEDQPRNRKVRTDTQGKFTLEDICSGSLDLYVNAEGGLAASALHVQAGDQAVKIVAFGPSDGGIPFQEPPFTADPQKEGLMYRWLRHSWRLVDGKGEQILEPSDQKPKGVRLPAFKSRDAIFAKWYSPRVTNGYLWVGLDRTHEHGQYDRLFIDTNADGHLFDEVAVSAYRIEQYRAYFGPVEVVLDGYASPTPYHLSFCFYSSLNRLNATSGGFYEGYVTVGEAKKRCRIFDKNADGTFDGRSLNPSECDLISFGDKDRRITRFVGRYIELDGALYAMENIHRGDHVNVNLTLAENVKLGKIRVPENITEFAAGGENGLFAVRPIKGVMKLPVGKYRINHWVMEREDEKGDKWTLRGHSFGESGIFEVSEKRETTLSVGEPLFTSLEQVSQKGVALSFINPKLNGLLGEDIDLTCGEDTPGIQLHIRDEDDSYDRTFTFEYG